MEVFETPSFETLNQIISEKIKNLDGFIVNTNIYL